MCEEAGSEVCVRKQEVGVYESSREEEDVRGCKMRKEVRM